MEVNKYVLRMTYHRIPCLQIVLFITTRGLYVVFALISLNSYEVFLDKNKMRITRNKQKTFRNINSIIEMRNTDSVNECREFPRNILSAAIKEEI